MTLFIYPDVDVWNFVIADLHPRPDVRLFPLNRYCNIAQRAVRKLSPVKNLPPLFLLGEELRHALKLLKETDSVVLCEYTEPILLSAIHRLLRPEVSRFCWLWNRKGEKTSFENNRAWLQHYGFQTKTYDEGDALRFNLQWHHQFFCLNRYLHGGLQTQTPSYDFFFIGYAKNREPEIHAMQLLLSAFSSSFTIVHNLREYIPYSQYMERASKARCIVDIIHSGEPSCTLRPLEALSLHKKLITNNPNIRNYSFYHPQNIFIFGIDDVTCLPDFVKSPFVELPEHVVAEYDVSCWIDAFQPS